MQVGLSRLLMSTRLGNFEESLENLKFCGHLGDSLEKVCAIQLDWSSFDQVLTFSSLVRAAENRLH